MTNEDKFCLRWNDFENNISKAFKELKDDEDFFDVTLACEGNYLQAHKVILSACSPFFRSILKVNKHPHPLLYLKGIKYEEMLSILDFMYHGEVNVAQVELSSFLAAAEDLQVKGLSAAGQEQHISSKLMLDTKSSKQPEASIDISNYTNKPYKQPKINPISAQERPNTESANVVDVDCDPLLTSNLQMEDQSMDWPSEEDDFGYQEEGKQAKQKGFVSNTNQGWNLPETFSCQICEKSYTKKKSLQNHMTSHRGMTYCSICDKNLSSPTYLRAHMAQLHQQTPVQATNSVC